MITPDVPDFWGFLRSPYGTPHVNNTIDALYLDGHAETFTRDHLALPGPSGINVGSVKHTAWQMASVHASPTRSTRSPPL